MRNIKLIIEYDGTNFHGWQTQPDIITVQGEIEKAISIIEGQKIKIFGASRTDKKVHARGQVANFYTESNIPGPKFRHAINSLLPKDIAIYASEEVNRSFHSRYMAKGKTYRYLVYNAKIRSPLLRHFAYHIPYGLNLDDIQKASRYFVGSHDFAGFMTSGSSIKDTVRRIYDFDIIREHDRIDFVIKGNGFLYNMVRIIVGTLLDVGRGRLKVEEIPDIIASKDRKRAGKTAEPQGLYLEKVHYD